MILNKKNLPKFVLQFIDENYVDERKSSVISERNRSR